MYAHVWGGPNITRAPTDHPPHGVVRLQPSEAVADGLVPNSRPAVCRCPVGPSDFFVIGDGCEPWTTSPPPDATGVPVRPRTVC